jgi:exodeoxyribonuclease VII small subunit
VVVSNEEQADVSTLSYEAARDELVRVVAELEQGSATLERSLTLWERGESLAARCEEWLVGARAPRGLGRGRRPRRRRGGGPPVTDPGTGRPIVAELGRPETDEETWARKDAARRSRRQHQTAFNLVLSLVASLAIVVFLVAVVARPSDDKIDNTVDYRQVASSSHVSGVTLAAPKLPGGYTANRADFTDKTADGVDVWTVGLLTPDKQFIGLQQGIDANPTWVANQLDQHAATGTTTIAGTKWTVYDRRAEGSGAGNHAYALVSTFGRNTIVLAGTADGASFRTVATRVAAQLG